MSILRIPIVCGLAQILVIFSPQVYAAPSLEAAGIDEAINDLASRQREIQSARVVFYETPVARQKSDLPSIEGTSDLEKKLLLNAQRAKSSLLTPKRIELVLRDDRLRLEEERPAIENQATLKATYRRQATFGGQVGKELVDDFGEHGQRGPTYALGAIDDKDITIVYEFVSAAPIVLALRPIAWLQSRGFDVAKDGQNISSAELNGERCAVAAWNHPKNVGISYEVWFSLGEKCLVRRIASRKLGALSWQMDVTDVRVVNNVYLPQSWSFTRYTKNGAGDALAASVSFAKINVDIPDETFDITFPEGTLVTDYRTETPTRYIIKKDGEVREISQREWNSGVPYDTLISTSAGELFNSGRGISLFVYVNVAILVLLALAVVMKRFT